jgi:hypothetical protein
MQRGGQKTPGGIAARSDTPQGQDEHGNRRQASENGQPKGFPERFRQGRRFQLDGFHYEVFHHPRILIGRVGQKLSNGREWKICDPQPLAARIR